jgi:hypothetical protein
MLDTLFKIQKKGSVFASRIYWIPERGAGIKNREAHFRVMTENLILNPPDTPIQHALERPIAHLWNHANFGQPFDSLKMEGFFHGPRSSHESPEP